MIQRARDASFVTQKNQNRMIYANYLIQQYNVQQGEQIRVRLQGDGIPQSSILPSLIDGLYETTASERDAILANNTQATAAPAADPYLTDKIYLSLTTTAATYKAAPVNTWVKITSTEYAALKTNITGLTTCGANDSAMGLSYSSNISNRIIAANRYNGTNTVAIPVNNYLFAVQFIYAKNGEANNRIYTNADSSLKTGYVQQGGLLPATTVSLDGLKEKQYYVLKGVSSVASASSATSFAIYDATTDISNGIQISSGLSGAITTDYVYSASVPTSSTSLSSSIAWVLGLQGLSASSVQWVTS